MYLDRVQPVQRRKAPTVSQRAVAPAMTTSAEPTRSSDESQYSAAPVGATDGPAMTKIRRSTYPPLGGNISPLTKIRRSSEKAIIRRVISEDEWKNRIGPVVKAEKEFTIWQGPQGIVLRLHAKKLQWKNVGTSDDFFADLSATEVAALKADSTLLPEHLGTPATFNAKRSDEVPMGAKKPDKAPEFVVTEFADEPLSLVHHTTGTGKDPNPHLTVENAHVAAFKDLFDPNTRDVKSKAKEDKGTINTRLTTEHGVGSVDNLNFFPAPSKKGKANLDGMHSDMSLADYLTFLVNALREGGAPREYGERIMQMSTQMAAAKELDMSQMFMRVDMDEKAFVRAVLIIDGQLPAGKKLAIPEPIRKTFARWWNQGSSPLLPEPDVPIDDVKETDWVASGKMGKTESYSVIEGKLAKRHFAEVSRAAKNYPPAPVLAQIQDGQAAVANVGK